MSRFFDNRVRDANTRLLGNQPMTIVFSSGNFANTCNNLVWDTVAAPATAKNVITVGASESYRPSPSPPLGCRPCTGGFFGRPPDLNATHVSRIAAFSSRGRLFQAYPASQLAHATRIKPDLVAPAVRVFSTVPYADRYPYPDAASFVGCTDFYPGLPSDYHTYGSGTSFAAPVVSGVAALEAKVVSGQRNRPVTKLAQGVAHRHRRLPGRSCRQRPQAEPELWLGPGQPEPSHGQHHALLRQENAGLAISTGEARSWTRDRRNRIETDLHRSRLE